ncbi:MAG: hypothetical protein HA495_05500 [Thaumarchaeota archaeon]|jgi:hypothetical protein|nr:hypothetical protein [Nitrososphaerota archaeon]
MTVQCPCGRYIENASEFKLLFLKKEQNEIDILCPNENCYIRELGYIKFEVKEGKPKFKEASFYPPFVTWNVTQLGKEEAQKQLKQMLKDLVTKYVDWDRLVLAEQTQQK